MAATTGMNTARKASCWMVLSNCATTRAPRPDVPSVIMSHGARERTMSAAVACASSSSCTPERRKRSSVVSASMMSITSSWVMRPRSRPNSSTTGIEIRLYFAISLATCSWSSVGCTRTMSRSMMSLTRLLPSARISSRSPTIPTSRCRASTT